MHFYAITLCLWASVILQSSHYLSPLPLRFIHIAAGKFSAYGSPECKSPYTGKCPTRHRSHALRSEK